MSTILKNLHMNKKLLALLFAVPGFGLAQSAFETYKVMGFAPNLEQVAVDSKDVTGHDVALANTRNGGWYADAKPQEVGVAQDRNPQFRIVKTGIAGIYKLYSVKNNKFVAYTAVGSGGNKTKFVEDENDPQTNWRIVPNIGANGTANNFDIFPGSVSNPNGGTPAWNAVGGVSVNARIGLWRADDGGSCWSIEVVTQQQLKFFSNYSATNDSYFMTIRDNYVHKNGENFTADKNLQFGDDNYRFQLVGTPDNFRIYNAATGQPIGTEVGAGLNGKDKDKEDNNRYRANKESYFSAQSYGGRVYVKETRKPNLYLNFRDGFLSTWNHEFAWTTRDPGSQILFTTEDGILAEAAKKLESELKAQYPDSKFGKDLGLYPQSMKSVVDNGVKLLTEAQGSSLSIAEKKQKYNEALEYVDYLKTAPLNLPQNGDLLYLSFERDSHVKYLTSTLHAAGDKDYDNKSSQGFLTTTANKASDAVFLYTLKGTNATLTSVATGRHVTWGTREEDNQLYPTLQSKAGTGTNFTVAGRDGKYIFEDNGKFLASDANLTYATVFKTYNATFAGLRLERVGTTLPVHIGESGFASFWCPFEYTVPEGVTAFGLQIVDGRVKLIPVEGNVPKNTGIILQGTANTDVNLTLVPNGTTPAITGNLLQGSAEPQKLTTLVYALKKTGGLVKVKDYMPAFKAYFTASESQVRELLDRGLTGVVSVATEAEETPVYDLSGRRVQQTTKGGVYVTNGKKFIAK